MHRLNRFESLEQRTLLAIDWINQIGPNAFNANNLFTAQEELLARAIINRAIDDWNAVILDQNFDNDNNANTTPDLELTFLVGDFGFGALTNITQVTTGGVGQAGWTPGVPTAATIQVENDNNGFGWFLDPTPNDDAEFTAIATPFEASFVDVSNGGAVDWLDFYLVVAHEIGHSLGIALTAVPNGALRILTQGNLFSVDWDGNGNERDTAAVGGGGTLAFFQHPDGSLTTLTPNGGGHIYEGGLADHPSTPTFENELMNPGRTNPSAIVPPLETRRQFISDTALRLLADAYGYTVTLPSDLVVDPDDDPRQALHTSSMHTAFDSQTGTLLVQGIPNNPANETFTFTIDGDEIAVAVSYGGHDFLSRFNLADVTQIVIARNGGNDNVNIPAALLPLVQEVQYVVSSNQDNATAGTVGDGIVDLCAVIPGNQVSLRAAIVDANGTAGGAGRSIFLPRGQYRLQAQPSTETTIAPNASINDFDILGNLTIIGTGAGASVIDASALDDDNGGVAQAHDRIFEIAGAGRRLSLTNLTLTGGNVTTFGGGAIFVYGGARVQLDGVAVVNNRTNEIGGGIRASDPGTQVTVRNSVFTGNVATGGNGGAISFYLGGSQAQLRVGSTIFARNSGGANNNVLSAPGVINEGNNVLDNNADGYFNTNLGDLIDTTTLAADLQIVTNVADVIDPADGAAGLSLREAVIAANAGNDTIWRNTLYSITDLRADGDDNGIVDQADWLIWKRGFGNSLTVTGVL